MTRRPAVILFDLDGTLVDSAADLASAVDALLAERGRAPLGEAEVRRMIGDGATELLRRAFAARTLDEAPASALPRFLELYGERCLEQTRAYDGIPELLARLHAAGRRLAVVTNKPQAMSELILDGLGLAAHLDAIVGPERASARKPSPEHVLAALTLLGASPAEAVMVGDGPTDVRAGRGAGVATCGVSWGYRPVAELEEAGVEHLVTSVADLGSWLG